MHRVSRLFATPRRALATVAILALIVAGAAYAAWTFTASGTGNAQVASIVAPTIQAVGTNVGVPLMPNGDGGLDFKITNSNTMALKITSVVCSGGCSGTAWQVQNPTACPTSNFSLNAASLTGLSIPVPPGATTITIPNAVHLSTNAPNGCMGMSVDLPSVVLNFST